jgi:hypothetical protein
MLHSQELHLKHSPFEESKITSFLFVQRVVIIQGAYSTVLRSWSSLVKHGLAIFQEELVQEI